MPMTVWLRCTSAPAVAGKLSSAPMTVLSKELGVPDYTLSINGKNRKVTAQEDTPMLWVLRDNLGLTGTKYGCGIAQCGACTVHIEGIATKSCVTLVSSCEGKKIITIEGLSQNRSHPVQKA